MTSGGDVGFAKTQEYSRSPQATLADDARIRPGGRWFCGPMPTNVDDLRLFNRIVSAGSLSETARRLGGSLAAVSRRLSAMETRLGARLVDRGTRRFALTAEGSLYYERGVAILAELDELETQVNARTSAPSGHIRIGAPSEIGRRRFAPLIAAFGRLHPQVTLELVLTDSRVDVIGDELDIGLHVDRPEDGNIVVRKLLSSRRIACASPAYLAARGEPIRPRDLAHHHCICLVRGRHVYNGWPFLIDGAQQEVRVRGSLLTSSAEVVHDWALAGHGVALKASWDIAGDLADGRLVEVLGGYSCNRIELYATYATRRHMPFRIRLLLDHLADDLSRDLP